MFQDNERAAPEIELRQKLKTVGATYRVIQDLGRGGNSHVHLVEAVSGPHRGLLFAIKVFVNIADPIRVERFNTEVAFLKDCNHPAVMRVFDVGSHTEDSSKGKVDYPFVVIEYLPKTLRHSMREEVSIREKIAFTLQLLSALDYLANRTPPIVHRDIKPENILVRGTSCVLADFGLLKSGDGIDPTVDLRVEPSTGIRFPRLYPTPDLLAYCKDDRSTQLSPKSDVFQLGPVVAELFTGELPMEPRTKPFDPIVMRQLGPVRSSQGAAIRGHILTMLNIDPAQRPAAADLFDAWEG